MSSALQGGRLDRAVSIAGAAARICGTGARGGWRGLRRVPAFVWISAAAAVLLAVAVVELTGAIAGVLASGRPVLVDPFTALGVLGHWLGETGVRRGAWPADVAGDLGKFKQVRSSLVLAIVVLAGVLAGCVALWRSMRLERLRDVYKARGARWAESRELARLVVPAPAPGRLTLGVREGKLLASENNASTLIIAPAQAGKTSGLAVPAMVEWQGPILATSVKGDLLKDTVRARELVGEVKVFDPTDATEHAGSSWSPVATATTWSAARRVSASILQIGMRQHGGSDDTFWRQAGASHLAPLLFAGNKLGATISDVLRWATSSEESDVEPATNALKLLVAQKVVGADIALHDLRQMWARDSRYRSSVNGTLSTYLDAWKEPELAKATANDPNGITPEWLLDGNNTLYLSAPAADQRRLRGLFCALVTEVIAAAFARAARTGNPLDPRLLLMMDEAANIAPLPNIDEIASTGPGQGVLLCTILQNLSQAEETWGKDRADTILANHRARLFGSGIGDTATLEYIQRILGDEARESSSISRKRAAVIDLGSRSESLDHRALLGHHETRQIAEGHALLVYGQLPPTQLQLRAWFRDRKLTALVEGHASKRRRRAERDRRAVKPQLRSWLRALTTLLEGLVSKRRRPAQGAFGAGELELPSLFPTAAAEPIVAEPAAAAVEPKAAAPAAAVADPLQLTFDDVADAPADRRRPLSTVPATGKTGDVRSRLERHLGMHTTGGTIASLRLASSIREHAALTGPLALVLQECDDAPAEADWSVATLLACEDDSDTIASSLMKTGASSQASIGPDEQWIGPDGGRVDVHYLAGAAAAQQLAGVDQVDVDGVGTLSILSSEILDLQS